MLLGDESLAEDVVQDVFMKIIGEPTSFDTDKKFSNWIYTVVKNQCLNHLRNEKNRQQLLSRNYSVETIFHTHANTDAKQLQQKIAAVVNTLSEKEKTIFMLRFQQELSIKEVAAIADIPEGSVKSGIYYLLKKMSTQLKDYIHAN
jgi:RNA polymerase sigma-70 factor (ECF subfamily)